MEGRDGASPGGSRSMQGSVGFHVQQRVISSESGAGGLLAAPPSRPTATNVSLASPNSDGGAVSPLNVMGLKVVQGGNYLSSGLGTPNASRVDRQRRKRGRPRKYPGADGGGLSVGTVLALTPVAPDAKSPTSPSERRGRGRPPGSGKKQQVAALGTVVPVFTPHVITIAAGEDVANKIFAFSQQGLQALCVLSANGAISNVTLRHDSSFGGSITYEGRYEILSLSGSFLSANGNGTQSRTGGLSVSLAASDGKVVGGSVSGLLIAATPVQIVVGSFVIPEGGSKALMPTTPSIAGNGESMVALLATSDILPTPLGSTVGTVAGEYSSPQLVRPAKMEPSGSKGTGSGGPSTFVNHQGGNSFPNPHHTTGQFGSWNSTPVESFRLASTDINISLPGE